MSATPAGTGAAAAGSDGGASLLRQHDAGSVPAQRWQSASRRGLAARRLDTALRFPSPSPHVRYEDLVGDDTELPTHAALPNVANIRALLGAVDAELAEAEAGPTVSAGKLRGLRGAITNLGRQLITLRHGISTQVPQLTASGC